MFNRLKSDIKTVESLENFIKNNSADFYISFNKKSRIELITLKKEFKMIILFNKKVLKSIDVNNDKNIKFILFLIKIADNLFLNMEFKLLIDVLKDNTPLDIKFSNRYKNLENINQINLFHSEILNLLEELTLKITKKDINNILINYYLYLTTSFNSQELIMDFQNLLLSNANNQNFNFIEQALFQKVFNLDSRELDNIQIDILNILDNHIFNSVTTSETKILLPTENTNMSNKNKFKPTDEQADIIKTSQEMQQGQVLIIEALAGCTKTSTLEMITNALPEKRFLYLAFNTKIVEDAKKRFPANTEVRTLHALGFKYEGRGKKIASNRDMNNIISELFNLNISRDFYQIFDINKVYNEFCLSANTIDELAHLEKRLINDIKKEYKDKDNEYRQNFFIKKIKDAIPYIERLYNYMITTEDITNHSTYLKKFVENAHNYSINYDFVVLDESQDVSRLLGKFILNRILSYEHKIIVVGDNNQKIYGFLGNINLSKSIKKVVDNSVYIQKSLTKTFRFSKDSQIENLTNLILKRRDIAIIGAKPKKVSLKKEYQLTKAYLSRGKLPVLQQAISFLHSGIDFNLFMEKEKDFDMDLIIDIYELYRYTMIIKKELISKNKINTSDLSLCEMKNYNNKDCKKKIESIIVQFKNERKNNIFPKFLNKKLKNIDSLYELEYEASKNSLSDILDSLKICYFLILNFNYFNSIQTTKQYKHIVDKSLSILIDEFSNENSLTIISTIHKVKGLEYEKVEIISGSSITRETKLLMEDDKIEIKESKGSIIGLCNTETSQNCKKKKSNNPPPLNSGLSIDFVGIFDDNIDERKQKISLIEIQENNDTKIPKAEFLIDRNTDIQEEYNILYVALTRAEMIIDIKNVQYIDTLRFMEFIENNNIEINNIIHNKFSNLLVQKDNKEKDTGVIYDKVFINIEVLKEFIFQFKEYNQ